MPELSGVYDAYYVQPVVKIKQNLSIWTLGQWRHYRVEYIESMPPSPASEVDMVAQAAATAIAANGTIAKRVVTILQVNDLELLQVRMDPIDNMEGIVWEQSGQAKFNSRNIQSRVDRRTRSWDPTLATTQFWVLGINRDMNLEVRNPMGYAMPTARFIFWGHRFILEEHSLDGLTDEVKKFLRLGVLDTVRKFIGETTFIPAEGRQS